MNEQTFAIPTSQAAVAMMYATMRWRLISLVQAGSAAIAMHIGIEQRAAIPAMRCGMPMCCVVAMHRMVQGFKMKPLRIKIFNGVMVDIPFIGIECPVLLLKKARRQGTATAPRLSVSRPNLHERPHPLGRTCRRLACQLSRQNHSRFPFLFFLPFAPCMTCWRWRVPPARLGDELLVCDGAIRIPNSLVRCRRHRRCLRLDTRGSFRLLNQRG